MQNPKGSMYSEDPVGPDVPLSVSLGKLQGRLDSQAPVHLLPLFWPPPWDQPHLQARMVAVTMHCLVPA